jgi:hypothetical protein
MRLATQHLMDEDPWLSEPMSSEESARGDEREQPGRFFSRVPYCATPRHVVVSNDPLSGALAPPS